MVRLIAIFLFSGLMLNARADLKSQLMGGALDVLKKNPKTSASTNKALEYLRWAEKLKKFHDSGELDQGDVLDVLHASGVVKSGGRPATKVHGKISQLPPPVENYGGAYRWPIDKGVVSSEFGNRWGKKHAGIDLAANSGVPVKASAAGVVIYAGSTMRGYGNALIVRHDGKATTLYSHNKTLLTKSGDKITQGQTIALLGSTGHSTGPHVHFEFRNGDQAVDPRSKLGKAPF